MDSVDTSRSVTEIHYHNNSPVNSSCEHELESDHHHPTNTYVNAAFECDTNASNIFTGKHFSNTWHGGDDALVYANLSEIARRKELEDIDRRPNPPSPDVNAQPLRITANGWREYRTLGGRSYYFHPGNGICQWKPPRNTTNGRLQPFDGIRAHESCPASTSTGETEFFAEVPLHREFQKIGNNSSNAEKFQKSIAECEDNFINNKAIMSHSLDCGMNQNKYGIDYEARHKNGDDLDALYDTPANMSNQQGTAIRHGFLEKCKIAENGIKLKRKDWANAYTYLYIGHLLFYKDQKSAEKTGKHYPAPTDVCDLRNASVTFLDNDKQRDKRRKHIISLILLSKTEYYFSSNDEDINDWFQALKQAIASTPISKNPTNTIISLNGSLQRSLRHKRDFSGTFSNKSTLHNSIKSRLKPSSANKALLEDHFIPTVENAIFESSPPAKATIIERLLRFFRSRPSMESLRERGIYKPEPVFGSTLSEICAREKSLIPRFINEVTALIEQKGIDSDGLYRVNGNLSAVQKIRCQIDQDCYDAIRREEDIHVLSGALKLFLRELQEPIFPVSMHKDFMSAMRESGSKRLKLIDDLLHKLPSVNKETLCTLILHLNRVATNSGKNRMQIHNLAIIFGPSLFCSEERSAGHLRNTSQDKGKNTGGKRKSLEKRMPHEEAPNQQTGPTQNLAYRMIVYGQILEFVLSEADRLAIFKSAT